MTYLLSDLEEPLLKKGQASFRYWRPNETSSFGHVALEINGGTNKEENIYISFAPSIDFKWETVEDLINNCKKLWSTSGKFIDKNEEREPDNTLCLPDLDTTKMIDECQRITGQRSIILWGIGKDNHTCASLAMHLIEIGGGISLLPGSLFHIFLLSFRTSAMIAAISPIYYSFLPMANHNKTIELIAIILSYSVNTIGLSLLEYWLANQDHVSCLKLSRKRSLIELSPTNCVIQAISMLGFGITGLLWHQGINLYTPESSFLNKLISDSICLVGGSVAFITIGWVLSNFIYALKGLKGIIRPSALIQFVQYLQNHNYIPSIVKKKLFLKESSLLSIILCTMLGNNIVRDIIPKQEAAFLIGSMSGMALGVILCFLIMYCIDRYNDNHLIQSPSLKNAIASHDPDPFQYACISAFTIVGIMISIYLIEFCFGSQNSFLASATSILGGVIGFSSGLVISKWTKEAKTECLSNNCWGLFSRRSSEVDLENGCNYISLGM